jgi:hypothetical protein
MGTKRMLLRSPVTYTKDVAVLDPLIFDMYRAAADDDQVKDYIKHALRGHIDILIIRVCLEGHWVTVGFRCSGNDWRGTCCDAPGNVMSPMLEAALANLEKWLGAEISYGVGVCPDKQYDSYSCGMRQIWWASNFVNDTAIPYTADVEANIREMLRFMPGRELAKPADPVCQLCWGTLPTGEELQPCRDCYIGSCRDCCVSNHC